MLLIVTVFQVDERQGFVKSKLNDTVSVNVNSASNKLVVTLIVFKPEKDVSEV